MPRRVVFIGLLVFLIITIAGLELTGANTTLSDAAKGAKNKLQTPTTVDTSVTTPEAYCKWTFSHYESSAYEEEWLAMSDEVQNTACKRTREPRHAEASANIVKRVISLLKIDEAVKWRTYDSMLPAEQPEVDRLFSRMHYVKSCYNAGTDEYEPVEGKGVQLIEPLWGILRDPFDVYCKAEKLSMPEWDSSQESQSKQHIMPQGFAPYMYEDGTGESAPGWRSHGIPPWHSSKILTRDPKLGNVLSSPQNIHLDLGSSYFQGWTKHKNNVNPAASGQWFYDHYHKRGQHFDRFIAVELETMDDPTAFQQVPDDLIGIYTLMNVGLTMDVDDKLNTLDMIKRIVKPEDFFVFKLDIDSAPIETPIVQALLADDSKNGGASALIDELMFEHRTSSLPNFLR